MRLTAYAKKQRRMRQLGWDDFHKHCPIEDFPGHGERERAEWEIGWRLAKDGQPRPWTEAVTVTPESNTTARKAAAEVLHKALQRIISKNELEEAAETITTICNLRELDAIKDAATELLNAVESNSSNSTKELWRIGAARGVLRDALCALTPAQKAKGK